LDGLDGELCPFIVEPPDSVESGLLGDEYIEGEDDAKFALPLIAPSSIDDAVEDLRRPDDVIEAVSIDSVTK
jgi:hypothetical protein